MGNAQDKSLSFDSSVDEEKAVNVKLETRKSNDESSRLQDIG